MKTDFSISSKSRWGHKFILLLNVVPKYSLKLKRIKLFELKINCKIFLSSEPIGVPFGPVMSRVFKHFGGRRFFDENANVKCCKWEIRE